MDCKLTIHGIEVSKKEYWDYLGYDLGKDLLSRLTYTYQPRFGQAVTITNYIYERDRLYLPRRLLYALEKRGIFSVDLRLGGENLRGKSSKAEAQNDIIRAKVAPRHNQQIILDHIFKPGTAPEDASMGSIAGVKQAKSRSGLFSANSTKKGQSAIILWAQTGFGKTVTAGYIIERLGQKAIIIVPNKSLQKQAYNEMKEFFNGTKINLLGGFGRINGGIASDCPINEANICIAIIDSAIKQIRADVAFMRQFGLCIIDEVHTVQSEKRKIIFWAGQCLYMLGLTATPDKRDDYRDKIYKDHFCRIIKAEDLPGYELSENKFKVHVNFIYYSGPEEYTKTIINDKINAPDSSAIMKQLVNDPYRIYLLARMIKNLLIKSGRYVLVFSERVEHLYNMRDAIIEAFHSQLAEVTEADEANSPGKYGMIVLTGENGTEEIQKYAREKARIIFTTYKYSVVGLNVPKIDTIIFSTPQKAQHDQKIGRAMRFGGNEAITRQVYDIVDKQTIYMGQKRKRMPIYEGKSATYSHVNIDWEEINAEISAAK